MAKKQRSVQYRYLDRGAIGHTDKKLAQLIREALQGTRRGDKIGERARARIADLEQIGQLTLLNGITGASDPQAPLGGELILYKNGFDLPAIQEALDSEQNEFSIEKFTTGGSSKPVEGALYFAVINDSVGLIASNAVTSRWLERYLTWLLKDAGEVIEAEDTVDLNQRLSVPGSPGEGGPAKEFAIHALPVSSDGEAPVRTRAGRASGAGATVVQVLQLLGVGDDAIESLQRDIPADGKLEGDFHVYIKEGRRKRELSSDTLNHAFRNSAPEDYGIKRRGSRSEGNIMTLAEPVRVSEGPAGLNRQEAVETIVEQLYRWAQQGRITLNPE